MIADRTRRVLVVVGVAGAAIALALVAYIMWLGLAPDPLAFARSSGGSYAGPSPTGVPSLLSHTEAVTRGRYLADAADCVVCHTESGGTPFAGGRPFKLPFGTLYTPNITPDRNTGIGAYTDADFLRVVHRGLARDGRHLYPAFPYASYTMLADADVLAIKAYLFSLKPVYRLPSANTLRFPFNQRWLMAIWSALFNPDRRFAPVAGRSAQWNRGAYLVEGAGHCAECHSPRNLLQAVDNRRRFAGGSAEGWNAYNITPDHDTGIGAWSAGDLYRYLATGHAAGHGTASGPMADVVQASLSRLAPGDLRAIVVYLRSVPARRDASLQPHLAGPAAERPVPVLKDYLAGMRLFAGNCMGCHAWSGAGAAIPQAQLTGARAVNDATATNVVQMILLGSGHVKGRPFMPGFGESLSDTEVATLANYVTGRFGSSPSRVTARRVAQLRAQN